MNSRTVYETAVATKETAQRRQQRKTNNKYTEHYLWKQQQFSCKYTDEYAIE